MLRLQILSVILLTFLAGKVWGQDAGTREVEAVRSAYQNLQYAEAEQQAQIILSNFQRYRPGQLVEVHTLLALIKLTQNEEQPARQQFELALSLNPELALDTVLVSPKVLSFFDEVKRNFKQQKPSRQGTPEVRYLVVQDPRSQAMIRSLVLPGWGQRLKDEPTKGWALTAVWVGLGAGTLWAHFARDQAQKEYAQERDPARIAARYDTFNTWHKVRNNLLLVSAGVWTYSVLDALIVMVSQDRGIKNVGVVPALSSRPMTVYFRYQF